MTEDELLTVNAFADIARTTRNILHHYDEIGVLSPALRGENRYRYYSTDQLAVVNLIRTLQTFGMSLAEIKELKDRRTPEVIDELFTRLIVRVNRKITDWARAKKLLLTLQKSIHSVKGIKEDEITIQFLPSAAIILGSKNDYKNGQTDYSALVEFYDAMIIRFPNLDLNYPVWGVFSEERIKSGDLAWPDRYYFFNPAGRDQRPAAFYAIGYTRGGYGPSDQLYRRMIDFIDDNGFEICGDAYKEYPLNEICISDPANYLVRMMITVRQIGSL